MQELQHRLSNQYRPNQATTVVVTHLSTAPFPTFYSNYEVTCIIVRYLNHFVTDSQYNTTAELPVFLLVLEL